MKRNEPEAKKVSVPILGFAGTNGTGLSSDFPLGLFTD
jgi:hypothetical protein